MDKAKEAISKIVSSDKQHKTTIDETTERAVTDEHVRPHQHEEVTAAVDKSVHQDHHHTVIQPIQATETLPEQHDANIMPMEHKTFDNSNATDTRAAVESELAQFNDSSVTHDTTHSASAAGVVTGERVHHHVHEHVQPVIQKETIAPRYVHTVAPVHETHHAKPIMHGTTTLPAKSLGEYTAEGGVLEGRAQRKVGEMDSCPRTYNSSLQKEQLDGDKDFHRGLGEKKVVGAGTEDVI